LPWTWKLRRKDDRASGTLVSFIVGTALFVVSSTVLVNFVVRPPATDQGLAAADLKTKAAQVLEVLLGSPGYPQDWQSSPDAVQRLGLLERGSTVRIDSTKFDDFAQGSLSSPSSTNGLVDYVEARNALGLQGYDFHLRVEPVFDLNSSGYGVSGMDTYHVGYVGHFNNGVESAMSQNERYALTQLPIDFSNITKTSTTLPGDVFSDDSATLKSVLVPLIGSSPAQTVIPNQGPNDDVFHVVNADAYSSLFAAPGTLTKALALTDGSSADALSALGFTKSKDVRAVLGVANMSGLSTATLTWNDYVDTHQKANATSIDPNDYGWAEVSADGGNTWYQLTNGLGQRSVDTWLGYPAPNQTAWTAHTVQITAANCAPCMGASDVEVAMHWHADNQQPQGYGWIMDDVVLSPTTTTGFDKTFETPDYSMLVIGSDVSQNAFTPDEVKNAIRDYVNVYGGRILVLGGQTNTQWLQPLFHVAIHGATPGVGTPDTTSPLLNEPNQLNWQTYDDGGTAWDFSGSQDASLFDPIVATGSGQDILAASLPGSFGSIDQGGSVMLTTYLPWDMPGVEPEKFFANALMYGKYHLLYADIGPPIPNGTVVETAQRTATMDRTNDDEGIFTEISFTLYLWQGNTTGVFTTNGAPNPPVAPGLTAGNSLIQLAWTWPTSNGTSPLTGYDVYRGTASGAESYVATVTCDCYNDTNVTNGTTYYYNVTAVNAQGQSGSSNEVSGTPAGLPMAPLSLSVTGGVGIESLSWAYPWSDGGAPVIGYDVYRNLTGSSTMALLVSESTNTSWIDNVGTAGVSYTYEVSAINAMGQGPTTAPVTGSTTALPSAPVASATGGYQQVQVSWTSVAGATSYTIYAGSSANPTTAAATVGAPALTWNETGLGNGVTRHYRVAATNGAGSSGYSNDASATTIAVPPAPGVPTVTQQGRGALNVSWLAVNAGTGTVSAYNVYAGSAVNSLSLLASVPSSQLYYVDTGLADGQTRDYAVSAVDQAGEGPQSTPASGTTMASPQVPTNVQATGGAGQIVVTWTDADATITNYTVYAGNGANPTTAVANVTTTTWTETGLGAGVTRHYRVIATNPVGNSTYSADASASTIALPVATAPTLTPQGVGGINVTWAAASGNGGTITGYTVWRSANGASYTNMTFVAGNATLYDLDTGLGNGTTWLYEMSASSNAGQGAQSSPSTATTYAAPGTPVVSVTPGVGQNSVSWPAVLGPAVNYSVYAGNAANPTTQVANVTTTSWTETGLLSGTTRHYRVIATNPVGNSTYSNDASATTISVPTASQPTVAPQGVGGLNVSWTGSNANGGTITGYTVWRSATGAPNSYANVTFVVGNATLYDLDTNLGNGTAESYEISASNDAGQGSAGLAGTGTTYAAPGVPVVAVTPGVGQNTVTWNAVSGPAVNYSVYAGNTANPTTQVANVTGTSWTETGLSAGTTRHYRVIATNPVGNSTYSNDASGTTITTPIAVAPTLTLPGVGQVNVSWTAASNGGGTITGYTVWRSTDGVNYVNASFVAGGSTLYYVDSNLGNGKTEYYEDSASNQAGQGGTSLPASTTTATTPGAPTVVASTSGSHVVLTITAPASNGGLALANYTIYRCGPSATLCTTTYLASNGGTGTSYTDNTVVSNHGLNVYWYQVTAWNAVGESAKSAASSTGV
jgi:fibronectin type 3 domain-containing protein